MRGLSNSPKGSEETVILAHVISSAFVTDPEIYCCFNKVTFNCQTSFGIGGAVFIKI